MSVSLDSLIAQGLRVGHLSDALDDLGLPNNAGGGYRLLGGKGGTTFGRAFTLRQMRAEPGTDPVIRHGEAAQSLAKAGDILVIDAGGAVDIVTWGEAHTLRALGNGLAGVVLHGATRDADNIAMRELPVLCRGVAPVRSKGRLHTQAIGEPLDIAGVKISAGDLIAMDTDGLVAIAPADEARVLERAAIILANEQERDRALEAAVAQRLAKTRADRQGRQAHSSPSARTYTLTT